ncbi:DUF429 domain-containing protein [Vibrio sp. WXL103]|uniref:DUF429 domain-containing protein n=1 Tax=unclassified Vibrio TaxID=2614977 RepID=UPI003EC5D990
MRLIGIDLAWQTETNPSALAIGRLVEGKLTLESIDSALFGVGSIVNRIRTCEEVRGVAIDAPLIINNATGQRDGERQLGHDYASRKAACHPTNQTLYPDAPSVALAQQLERLGYQHANGQQWQIECYPHPAMIECFALSERLLYKKGRVAEKKAGQIRLAQLITQLRDSPVLPLLIDSNLGIYLTPDHINSLKGRAVKTNEDVLDAIVCLYIAGLYQMGCAGTLYGDVEQGYIWVPKTLCIT